MKDSPDARTVVKSGATGPSGRGFSGSPSVPGGPSVGASAEVDGGVDGTVAGDVDSVAPDGIAATVVVVSDVPDAHAAASSASARNRSSLFMASTVPTAICYSDDCESC